MSRDATACNPDAFPIVKRKEEARPAEKNAAGEGLPPGRCLTNP